MTTVREAADALRRQRFATQTADELAALAQDADAWAAYVAGADSALSDGIA